MKYTLILLLPVLACSAKPAVAPGGAGTSVNADDQDNAVELPSRAEQLAHAICGQSLPCDRSRMDEYPAGTDAMGRDVMIMIVDATEPAGDGDGDGADDGADDGDGDGDGDGDDGDGDEERRDRVAEYWVGVFEDETLISHAMLTSVYFEDEEAPDIELSHKQPIRHRFVYSAGREQFSIEIADNRLIRESAGYHAGHDWGSMTMYRLSPVSIIFEASSSGDAISGNDWEHRRDWLAHRSGEFFTQTLCSENQDDHEDLADAESAERAFLEIPVMGLPDGYRQQGWRAISPGACALSMDAENALPRDQSGLPVNEPVVPAGFVTHGAPDSKHDSTLHMLMGDPRTLYVEIHDDTWMTTGKNWLHTDHLEIWLGPIDPSRASCVNDTPSRDLAQWGIRLDTGAVIAAYGKPQKKPAVDLVAPARPGEPARLAIVLPDMPYRAITVVYSDSDSGTGQDYLLATSALRYGVADSLGTTWIVNPKELSCTMAAKRLERIDKRDVQ